MAVHFGALGCCGKDDKSELGKEVRAAIDMLSVMIEQAVLLEGAVIGKGLSAAAEDCSIGICLTKRIGKDVVHHHHDLYLL